MVWGGAALGGSEAVTASDVDECLYVALLFLRAGGSDGGKELLVKSIAGLVFFIWSYLTILDETMAD